MEKYHIAFMKEETDLLSKIDLRSHHQNHDEGRAAYLANQEPILALLEEFEKKVGNPEWVSSSDIVPIGKAARDLSRRYLLDIAAAPEEFFKLCLDMGLGLSTA
ncbi:hypothetical protein ACRYWZ_18165 (plasmid) [Agrobacterium deltaense]|uniref:hypothetical protein n=1 Tax=Agrobacterium deltaense TaxID=1183412 RepID=UPI003D959351